MSIYRSAEGEKAVLSFYHELLASWPVPKEEFRIQTDLGETFVTATGNAGSPPLVILHGSMSNSAFWLPDIVNLSASFRVYTVDTIGEPGLSAPARPPLSSGAYAPWIKAVLDGLRVEKTSLIGESLGGWMAVNFTVRHPERVTALALSVPGGIGRQKNFLINVLPYLLLGEWGRKRLMGKIFGEMPKDLAAEAKRLQEFMNLINRHFLPRTESLPSHTDADLRRLAMPVFAVIGGKDIFLDSLDTKARLEANLQNVEIDFRPEGLHFIPDRTQVMLNFLMRHKVKYHRE